MKLVAVIVHITTTEYSGYRLGTILGAHVGLASEATIDKGLFPFDTIEARVT